MTTTIDNFYCSQKFWWLSIDVEKFQTLSCCSATPEKIDLNWLTENPNKLFNSPKLQYERQLMLNNQEVASCSSTCWQAERQNVVSRRLLSGSNIQTHTDIEASPSTLHIIVGSNCNMTCVYCCKQYSTAWLQEIKNNPDYQKIQTTDDRFLINDVDRVRSKLSQKEIHNSRASQQIFGEIAKLLTSDTLETITITGGEPFLYLGLKELIDTVPANVKIKIWSGLGVDTNRLDKELSKIAQRNVTVLISAESVGSLYEFVRSGNTWDRLNANIALLKKHNIAYEFYSTISNLTVHGILDFIDYAKDVPITFAPCTDPDFLGIHVMDNNSKQQLLIDQMPPQLQTIVLNSIKSDPTELQKQNLQNYIKSFTQYRQIQLPPSLQWIDS